MKPFEGRHFISVIILWARSFNVYPGYRLQEKLSGN